MLDKEQEEAAMAKMAKLMAEKKDVAILLAETIDKFVDIEQETVNAATEPFNGDAEASIAFVTKMSEDERYKHLGDGSYSAVAERKMRSYTLASMATSMGVKGEDMINTLIGSK